MWTHARSARAFIVLTTVLGALTAGLVIAQAIVIAHTLGPLVSHHVPFAQVRGLLIALAILVAARSLTSWAQERFSHRAAIGTIQELRAGVLAQATRLGPRYLGERDRASHIATLVTRGLGQLEPYFVKYLPALFLAATVTPAAFIVILYLDWVSCLAVIITLPLLPIFMILIGKMTQQYSTRKLAAMSALGAQVLDLLAGLPTLKALGRERGPETQVRRLGKAHRDTTMATLRVAFLSGAVLELLTTLSVAIVAVEIGLRLVAGHMDLTTGLAVLILAPEVYLPIRQVALHFHASSDGLAAADAAFTILATPAPAVGTAPAPDLSTATLELRGVSVHSPGRGRTAPAGLSATIEPGSVVALAGPNGAGKSTAIEVLLGLTQPDEGEVRITTATGASLTLADLDLDTWRTQFAWVPQRPTLWPGTVAENLALGSDDAPPKRLAQAAQAAGFTEVLQALPDAERTVIGAGGVGLSVGERQRLALTRALASRRPVVVLDEPTAHLDALSEAQVIDAIGALRGEGRTVILITHRPALRAVVDHVVQVHAANLAAASAGSATEPAASGGAR